MVAQPIEHYAALVINAANNRCCRLLGWLAAYAAMLMLPDAVSVSM